MANKEISGWNKADESFFFKACDESEYWNESSPEAPKGIRSARSLRRHRLNRDEVLHEYHLEMQSKERHLEEIEETDEDENFTIYVD